MQNKKTKIPAGLHAVDRDISSGRLFENQDLGLLTIEQVADALCKAPGTIRNMIARRELPFVRIGNRNMIRKVSLEAWLTQKEYRPWE